MLRCLWDFSRADIPPEAKREPLSCKPPDVRCENQIYHRRQSDSYKGCIIKSAVGIVAMAHMKVVQTHLPATSFFVIIGNVVRCFVHNPTLFAVSNILKLFILEFHDKIAKYFFNLI
jgi:hypothetical protein